MATLNDWVEGVRARTLPASVAPVFAGTGIALWDDGVNWARAGLCLVIALALQIGVNLSNDYSDGVRGTDDFRSGPPRLTGGGKTSPKVVLAAALGTYAFAALIGIWLIALTGEWWLLILGVAALAGAWFYTGGKHPYGYAGLGEVGVFIFFGLMSTCGTIYMQLLGVPAVGWMAGCAMGLIACSLLMINNIRDIPTDAVTGKHTLAVRLGDRDARLAYVVLLAEAFALALVMCVALGRLIYLCLLFVPSLLIAVRCVRRILARGEEKLEGRALIPILRDTGFVELLYGLAVFGVFALASFL